MIVSKLLVKMGPHPRGQPRKTLQVPAISTPAPCTLCVYYNLKLNYFHMVMMFTVASCSK